MKKLGSTLLLALALLGLSLAAAPQCYAQVVKADSTKTPSKISIWAQTQKAKCEKIIENIENSGFGKFVGDAVKYTKKGIQYAKDTYERGMELYNQVLDSPEYKSAMISKEIAQESIKLKTMQENKLKKQKDIEAEMNLLKEQTAAKIAAARQNIQVVEQSAATTDTASAQAAVEQEIELIQSNLDSGLSEFEVELKDVDEEFAESILKQSEKIAKLTKKLADTASQTKMIKKSTKEDSKKALKKNHEQLFAEGTPSVAQTQKISRRRKAARGEALEEAMVTRSDQQRNLSADTEKVDTKENLADTMPGESEGSGVNVEVLTEQMQILQKYINVVLADLKLQAAVEIASLRRIESAKVKTTFNLCDYTDQSNVGMAGIKKKADSVKNKVTGTIDKAQSAVAKAKNKVEQAKAKINEVKSEVNAAKELAGQAADLAKDAKNTLSQGAGASSLEGMF